MVGQESKEESGKPKPAGRVQPGAAEGQIKPAAEEEKNNERGNSSLENLSKLRRRRIRSKYSVNVFEAPQDKQEAEEEEEAREVIAFKDMQHPQKIMPAEQKNCRHGTGYKFEKQPRDFAVETRLCQSVLAEQFTKKWSSEKKESREARKKTQQRPS